MRTHHIIAELLIDGSVGQYDVFTTERGQRLPPPDLRDSKRRRGERRLALAIMGVVKK
jgi:hypothetical protein